MDSRDICFSGESSSSSRKRGRPEDADPGVGFEFEHPDNNSKHPRPPIPISSRLREKKVGKGMIEGGLILHSEHDEAIQRDIMDGAVCTFCFVGRVDQNGGMPTVLQKLLFLLHMVHDGYEASSGAPQKPGQGDIKESNSAGGHCVSVGNFRYHRIDDDGTIKTLPLFKVHVFVDEAVTSVTGTRPMTGMYVFCTVEIPQTFNFLRAIQDCCASGKKNRRGAPPSEEMRELWVDVMQHHLWFGSNRHVNMGSDFQSCFSDMFDVNSKGFLPCWANIANCVRVARLHMMTEAILFLEDALDRTSKEAAGMVVVRFRNIDRDLAEVFDVNRYDQVWALLSRTSMVNFQNALSRHVALLAQHSKHKDNPSSDRAGDYMDIVEEGNAAPAFEPPLLLSLPTMLSLETDSEVAEFVTEICANPEGVRIEEVLDFIKSNPGVFRMKGFPPALMVHTAELGLFWPRQGSPCANFATWLQRNKDVGFPSSSSLRILMAAHQSGVSDSGLYASFLDKDNALDPALRTLEDFRLSLLRDIPENTGMIYGRAECFYRAHMRSIFLEEETESRLKAWSAYLLTVAQPLTRTYAAADSGRFGGKDPRINVMFRLGDLRLHRDGVSCRLASVFKVGYEKMHGELARDAKWVLGKNRGTLMESLVTMNAVFAWRNGFMCLKKNNLELFFRLVISGLSFKLSHNKCVIPQAPNHIGTTLWVLDFMGRVLVDYKDGKLQGTQIKTWGCGVDKVEAEYELADHPKTYAAASGLENIAEYPELRDTRNSSDLGLQKTHSVSGPHESLRQVPDRYFCTEIKSNLSANSAGRTEYGKFCDMMARQTRSGAAPSRTTCVKDDVGNIVPRTEYGAAYMELLLASSNQETRRDCVHTFAAVVTRCFSGAMDMVDSGNSDGAVGAVDLGVSSKFVNQPMDESVHNSSGWLFLAAMSVAQVTASQQMRGLLSVTPTIMDRAIMETLYQIVGHAAHFPYISPESGCVSQWSREKEKVESVMPSLGLLLHASNSFSKQDSAEWKKMKFSEFVHDCTVNWLSCPVPMEIMPEINVRLLNGTIDWCFWLLMGIFIDYFKVPTVGIDELENFFDGMTGALPHGHGAKISNWLSKQCLLEADSSSSLTRKSSLFITTGAPDANDDENSSLCLVNVASTRVGEETPIMKRACDKFAGKLHALYGTRLKNSCNIHNSAALSVMLSRYSNKNMPKDRFGAICTTGSRGWESWHAFHKALRPQSGSFPYDSVLDGHSAQVKAETATAPHALYATPAVVCELRNGNEWIFGVEPRFLLWAAAIFGGANPISQPTFQRVSVHWTQRLFSHRIPHSIYPYDVLFGSVPSTTQDGFSIASVNDRTRPETMMRCLPFTAVEENNPRMLQAVIDGRMPEDYVIVEAQQRLAQIVESEHSTKMDYQNSTLPELSLPGIPRGRWVYFVFRNTAGDWPAAVFSALSGGEFEIRVASTMLLQNGDLDDDTVSKPGGFRPASSFHDAIKEHGDGRAIMRPHFHRRGILVDFEDMYAVIVKETDGGDQYFNPDNMMYRLWTGDRIDENVFFNASSDYVERNIVPVGSPLFLRLDVDAVTLALTGKGYIISAIDRMCDRWDPSDENASGVVSVMLLYDIPIHADFCIGDGIWVGLRIRQKGVVANNYKAIFLQVSPDMLLVGSRLGSIRKYDVSL